ncbi:DUF6893 family small protein [Mycobacterium botniense]|uniref:Uncharacterized protein n=1 Tax=Mycobacterium botniense TaxID=84962 RepID=A0A7I9Y3R3_9MYCO|nr:hypothetical protein [Mycobacterium botniense]GFG76691.1 hypothetical protein MBOT_40560 [Mycobacterium botniense]
MATPLEIIGWVFIGIIALAVLIGVVMGLVNIGDARRYLKIRRM